MSSNANAYVPTTASAAPTGSALAGVPVSSRAVEQDDRPAERVLGEHLAVVARPTSHGWKSSRVPAVGRGELALAEDLHVPEVHGLVAVPRQGREDELVRQDRDDPGDHREDEDRPVRPQAQRGIGGAGKAVWHGVRT